MLPPAMTLRLQQMSHKPRQKRNRRILVVPGARTSNQVHVLKVISSSGTYQIRLVGAFANPKWLVRRPSVSHDLDSHSTGTQKVPTNREDAWIVNVVIQGYDSARGYVCGRS